MNKKSPADFHIAVIGMAFRFPGDLSDEGSFWEALREGRDLVSEIDSDRWATQRLQHPKPSEPGRSKTFSAGVLSRIVEFDAGFFGISPREAAWLDPQQRLLLEMTWEAFENSGILPSSLAGSDCSVHVGISSVDYGMRVLDDLSSISSHSMTGNTMSIAANRLSYVFDLRGPSLAVDTACSSSLVALHQACNSLRGGESSIAVVGGVSLLLHPYSFVGFSKASMLSASGRCRAFDASGDGYVRGEGGAVLLLKPLHQAVADGDNIQSVILATGINADGGRKTGLTIPSCKGQSDLMQAVLSRSGVSGNDVSYVEAHGTGTAVGDPVEATAIGEIYGRSRSPGNPLPIGSVKTNLGHLEAASGMAGLVKAIMVLKNRALPPSLHLVNPNPRINFNSLNIEVVTAHRLVDEPPSKKMVVGVNSFGFGGANAHVLLQEFGQTTKTEAVAETQSLSPPLFLSARTPQALRDLAGRYALLLEQQPHSYYDIAYGASMRRDRMEKNLVLGRRDASEMVQQLNAFSKGEAVPQVVLEDALEPDGGIAFIYSGNGSQWRGMGQLLLNESSRFSELMSELDSLIFERAGFSVIAELQADSVASRLDDTAVGQPLLFAMQVVLTTMLRESGVHAQAVTGHSVGEVAAAWAAGALRLDQAIDVICARSSAQATTRGQGRMAAIGLSNSLAVELLASENIDDVEIASINSPKSVTLAGPLAALERVKQVLAPRDVFFYLLDLDYAFHSQAMDPIRDRLISQLKPLVPSFASTCAFISTVTGAALSGDKLGADYWWRNVRQPVLFKQAITATAKIGCSTFVEVGPHPVLQRYITECLAEEAIVGRVLPTLKRGNDGPNRIEEAVFRAHVLTVPQRREVFFPVPGRAITLPTYPWQRERHWHPRSSESSGVLHKHRVHPLLGWRLIDAAAAWENVLDTATCPWLADHKVANAVVLPGSAYVEMALAAAREHFGGVDQELEELDILAPIVFDGDHARSIRFEITVRDSSFNISSRQRLSDDGWTLNAVGRLLGQSNATKKENHIALQATGQTAQIDHDTHYRLTEALGLQYGPAFRGLGRAQVYGQTLLAVLDLPAAVSAESGQYLIHPAVLDVCFQSLVDFFQSEIEAGHGLPLLPVKVGRLRHCIDAPVVQFRVALKRQSGRSVLADFELLDAAGNTVAVLENCRFRAASVRRRKVVPACWQIVPKLIPHPGQQQNKNIPNADLLAQLSVWFSTSEVKLDRAHYFKDAQPLFEAMTVAFIRDIFQGWFTDCKEQLQKSINQPEEVEVSLRPFFIWMVTTLQQNQLLVESEPGVWTLDAADLPPAKQIWRTLLRDNPAALPELVLAARLGSHVSGLLNGSGDTQNLVKDLGQSHQIETLFDDSPAYLGSRLAVQQTLRVLASQWPADGRLRVLEVVAGASCVAQSLSDEFPELQIDYVVAHENDDTYAHLRAEYAGHPFVSVAKVDGDNLDLSADHKLPDYFDVIILRHTLHRSSNPVRILASARRRLAYGGLLILAERHADTAADFIFGLDSRWWRAHQNSGFGSSLSTPMAWEQALINEGFAEVTPFAEPASAGLNVGSYLLLAKRPDDVALAASTVVAARWLFVCDSSGPSRVLAGNLRLGLEAQGQSVQLCLISNGTTKATEACFDPEDPLSAAAILVASSNKGSALDHLVYLSGLGSEEFATPQTELDEQSVLAPATSNILGITHLVQAFGGIDSPPKFWLLTSGGALAEVHSSIPSPTSSLSSANTLQHGAVWGLGRVVMNEYPALGCMLIDLNLDPASADAARQIQDEMLNPDGESEIMLTGQGRFGLRLESVSTVRKPDASRVTDVSRFKLDFRVPGQLRNLVWVHQPEQALAPDEVEVRVVATGLNFRDVIYLMGLLPDEAVENGFAGASLGLEFSGVVTRIGAPSGEFAVGDSVLGFGSACFASHVVTQPGAMTHKPADWSFESAATVPTVFFTVYYALKHLANIQPGERILIHGAAGGVGIAAIQMALHLGAEIYATVGSAEKRDFVSLLGADHVFDSRSLAFADDILAITGGKGVDVVLNSLAGEAIRRNLHVLAPFGRFLELGKRDFFENTPIGLRPFKDNISYFGIDADQLLLVRPDLAGRLFREVMALFREGVLFPLPYRTFSANHVVDAFRAMQQARQIGKVVVLLDGAKVPVVLTNNSTPKICFTKDAAWLVTGGLAGFGLESARWLASRGVRHLVLTSRRGSSTPGAAQAVQMLEAMGAHVSVIACDIANLSAVQDMLAGIYRDGPPLTGILHAAMVLDDRLIDNLDAQRMQNVLAPKMTGAWNLHRLTLDMGLEHFVLYSSVTTSIGNPGQANYVAANASLESLANMRRDMGLPATCIGWGPIGDVGYLTRNQAVKDSLSARMGAEPMAAQDALDMLDGLLTSNATTTTVANFNWSALSRLLPSAQTARFESLRRQADSGPEACADGEDIQALIAGKTADEVHTIVRALVISEVAQVLCVGADRVDSSRSLHDLGMDSLMGVELALGLEKRFGIQLPAMMLSEGPTIDKVAARIVDRMMAGSNNEQVETDDTVKSVIAQLALQHGADASDEEIALVTKQLRANDSMGA